VRDGKHHELIDGELVPVPSGGELGQIVANIMMAIAPIVRDRGLDHVVGSTAGFQCFPGDPNRVRRPHVAFVSHERWPRNVRAPGHCPVAPELAAFFEGIPHGE
jgi:Uma2 family endonuclease